MREEDLLIFDESYMV